MDEAAVKRAAGLKACATTARVGIAGGASGSAGARATAAGAEITGGVSVAQPFRAAYVGSGLPVVSSPKGRSANPIRNAIDVSATGVPIVWNYGTPARTRNVMPAPTNRPADVANANALARHSVGYCSGSHNVYIAKLAPPSPRNQSTTKNGTSAFGRKNT